MKMTSLQTIAPILMRNHDRSSMFQASDKLELVPIIDGDRRDVIIRRPGEEDFIVWQGNIAGGTVNAEESVAEVTRHVLSGGTVLNCDQCGKTCASQAGLAAHMRSHGKAD